MGKKLFILLGLIAVLGCIRYNVNGTTPQFFAVGDQTNFRILIWREIPIQLDQPADVVIGQPNMSSGGSGVTASTFSNVFPFSYNNTSLFVPDQNVNRVLIWNKLNFTNGQPADIVLGQPNFTSSTINYGGISASSLHIPCAVLAVGNLLYVSDSNNMRILGWLHTPTQNMQPADFVLGQTNFTSIGGGTSSTQIGGTTYFASDGVHFIVDDTVNNRILIWNSLPTTTYAAASIVLGQPDFTSSAPNNPSISAATISSPTGGVSTDGVHLAVGDAGNNRVLIWNSIPTTTQQPADLVIGQPDFVSSTANNTPGSPGTVSAQSLDGPNGVFVDGVRLYISDRLNNRVLIWNSIPVTNQQPADLVLGQPNMSSGTSNYNGITATSIGVTVGGFSNLQFFGVNKPGGY